jgi:hypothetical protein
MALTSSELAAFQADAAAWLPTAATLWRPDLTDTGYGSGTETLTQVASFNCLLGDPVGPVLAKAAEQIAAALVWAIWLPTGVDIRPQDVLITATDRIRIYNCGLGVSNAVLQTCLGTELE